MSTGVPSRPALARGLYSIPGLDSPGGYAPSALIHRFRALLAAAVAASGAQVLLVPAQNMMRREKALWWQARHNEIRARRAQQTGMWLVSADVTGERDESRIGLGPTCVIDPVGQVVAQVRTGMTGMATIEIDPP